jgi:hypothetical protein
MNTPNLRHPFFFVLRFRNKHESIPICSMYGIFTNIYPINILYMEHLGIESPQGLPRFSDSCVDEPLKKIVLWDQHRSISKLRVVSYLAQWLGPLGVDLPILN